jgi:hypothetical protein
MVVRNLRQPVDDERDRSQAIRDETKKWLKHEPWTPIMAALLVSGIRPSDHWLDVPPAEHHRDDRLISHRDLFNERLLTSKNLERGLDNEAIPHSSIRFMAAEAILTLWDQTCSEDNFYRIDLSPRVFLDWLWRRNRDGHVHIPNSTWLDTFKANYPHERSDQVLSIEMLTWLNATSKKVRKLSPKHRFGDKIAIARSEATQADDPDEILERLADMMGKGEISGVTLLKYSRKSDLQYLQNEDGKAYTLRRDSFFRQLRRMVAKESPPDDPASSRVPSDGLFPDITPVAISPGDINMLTSKDELAKLTRGLLWETIAYVRWAAAMQVSDTGWSRDEAILVGNVVRLAKLLVGIDTLAFSKMEDVLNLAIPLAVETIVDLKYLLENGDAKMLDSYVGIPSKKGSKILRGWTDLDLKHKAEATGFHDVYTHVLQDAPSYLHGSWKDLTENHLSPAGSERYRVKPASTELKPRPLIAVSILSIDVTYQFSHILGDSPAVEKLQNALKDLHNRLKIAHEEFAR